MARKATLTDLRTAMRDIYRDLIREDKNGEIYNDAVLERLERDHSPQITQLAPVLIKRALVKLLNEACARKTANDVLTNSRDLFGELQRNPRMIATSRGRKRNFLKFSFQDARSIISHRKARVAAEKDEDLNAIIRDLERYKLSDEDTLEDALERKMKAEEG